MKTIVLILLITLSSSCSDLVKEEDMNTKEIITLIKNNDIIGMQNAIKNGLNINLQNTKKESLLLIATQNNRIEIATLLVENGADVNKQAENLDSPFLLAGANGQTDLVKLYLENGARFDIYNRYYGTALIPASERGHVRTVELLSSIENFPINHINNLGWTALMEAVVLGNGSEKYQEIVKILITNGADINIPDFKGTTVLEHAIKKKQYKIAEIITNYKSNHNL